MSKLRLSAYGPNAADGLAEALPHVKELLRELTREVTGDADAIRWVVSNLRCFCDRCDRDRPDDHPGWFNDGRYDYCPPCAATVVSCRCGTPPGQVRPGMNGYRPREGAA